MSLSIGELPCFDGQQYKQWVDKFTLIMMMLNYLPVLDRTLTAPVTTHTEPTIPVGATATAAPTTAQWAQYNAELGQFERQNKLQDKFDDMNGKAKGALNQSLSPGIWEQVKAMTAATAWTWLRTTFARQQFVEILEDYKILTAFKVDLSDPNPQIAKFRHHYTRISHYTPAATTAIPNPPPVSQISESIAALTLLSALPLSPDPSQDSIYQRMMETFTETYTVPNMTLGTLTDAIRNTWAQRFGHLPESQHPRRGTFYLKKGDKAPKKALTVTAQK